MKFQSRVMVLATLFLWACSGKVDSQSGDQGREAGGGEDNGPGPGGGGGTASVGEAKAVGTFPLRRLSRTEYNNTVKQLLGDTSRPADSFPREARAAGGFVETLGASSVEIARYREAADNLAAATVKQRWSRVVPCTTEDDACAKTFIESFGAHAFRRPLSADEVTEHLNLYKKLRAAPIAFDHKLAVQTLISAILQSPRFLYHFEKPAGKPKVQDGAVVLSGYEVASRLSYLLWQSMPDDELFAAAKDDTLLSPDELAKQARRMLADPKAGDGVGSFVAQILDADRLEDIDKDRDVYPSFSYNLATSMQKETRAFAAWAFLQAGTLDALLTSNTTFVDKNLATLYGVSDAASFGTELKEVKLDANTRSGLLTQASFLTVQAAPFETSPIKRGVVLLERFLCERPPVVPDQIPALKPSKPNMQTREKFEEHTKDGACAACHKVMDPLGFAFESFDGIGAYRPMDQGRPVNTSGSLELDDKTVAFSDAKSLMAAMAASPTVQRCMATQLMRFGLGRDVQDADAYSLGNATKLFQAKKRDLRELLVALVATRSFLFRAPFEGEVL